MYTLDILLNERIITKVKIPEKVLNVFCGIFVVLQKAAWSSTFVDIEIEEEDQDYYRIIHGDTSETVHKKTMIFKIVTIFEDIISQRTDGFILHGSAISHKNNAILFSGSSGSGKTTIIETLYNNKFADGIISDDLLVIDNGKIYPILLPLKSRNSKDSSFTVITMSDTDEIRYVYNLSKNQNKPLDIKYIFFPKYGAEENELIWLNSFQKFDILIKNHRKMKNYENLLSELKTLSKNVLMGIINYNNNDFLNNIMNDISIKIKYRMRSYEHHKKQLIHNKAAKQV